MVTLAIIYTSSVHIGSGYQSVSAVTHMQCTRRAKAKAQEAKTQKLIYMLVRY